ncbi:MAG: hypothetical protein OXG35_18290 [Acidobacteria bacterium]|nr:hypothetical protein [Acidobacteriota bacterium]
MTARSREHLLQRLQHLRHGFRSQAARQMHAAGDDRLLDPPQSSNFDDQEWDG